MVRKMKESKKTMNAVMTVEASLVLPVFLLLFMNLLSMIEGYRIHSNVMASLWEEGRKAAETMYLNDAAKIPFSETLSSFSVQQKIKKNLDVFPVWEKIVVGKRAGFLVRSEAKEDGTIRISCSYRMKPLFAFLMPSVREVENHYYGHAWIGYVPDGSAVKQEETYVYITETGTVYHRNRGCSYLNPSIRRAGKQELENLRNKDGAVYYACPLCDGWEAGENCYITDYGTNYHTSAACSGLKRTIYEVKLSEVGSRSACSKCGG